MEYHLGSTVSRGILLSCPSTLLSCVSFSNPDQNIKYLRDPQVLTLTLTMSATLCSLLSPVTGMLWQEREISLLAGPGEERERREEVRGCEVESEAAARSLDTDRKC